MVCTMAAVSSSRIICFPSFRAALRFPSFVNVAARLSRIERIDSGVSLAAWVRSAETSLEAWSTYLIEALEGRPILLLTVELLPALLHVAFHLGSAAAAVSLAN